MQKSKLPSRLFLRKVVPTMKIGDKKKTGSISVCTLLVVLLVSYFFVSSCLSQGVPNTVQKSIPMAVGNRWTYRVQIPKDVHLIVNPYFVHPDDLLATSKTNGVLARPRGPEEATFTVKCAKAISDLSCRVDVDEAGLRLWFNTPTTEQRLVVVSGDGFLTLELHGVTKIGDNDPWILGQVLAVLSKQSNQAKGNVPEWLAKHAKASDVLAEPLRESVSIPAGEFRKGFHSVMKRKQNPYGNDNIPDYTIESWTGDKVGLVKYVMKDAGDKVLFTVELVSYEAQ
jgi:hypothetical protein